MQLPIPFRKRGVIPPGIPRINWRDPLTYGLTGCYLPSAHAGARLVYNLVGGEDMAFDSATTYGISKEGVGLNSTVSDVSGASVLTQKFRYSDSATVYWRGLHVGAPFGNGVTLIGTSGTVPPYFGYCISTGITAPNDLGPIWNSNGTGTQSSLTFFPTASTIGSYGATFQVNGNTNFYVAGNLFNTTAFGALAPTYDNTMTMGLEWSGSPVGAGQNSNSIGLLGLVWHRALSKQEMQLIDLDPYRFLTWPDDYLSDELVKRSKTAIASLDAILALLNLTKTTSLGAFLQKTTGKVASLDSVLFATVIQQTSLGAFIQQTVNKTASLDGRLIKVSTTAFAALNALLQATHTNTAGLDGTLTRSAKLTASLDLSIIIPSTATTGLMALILPNLLNSTDRTIVIPEIPRTIYI